MNQKGCCPNLPDVRSNVTKPNCAIVVWMLLQLSLLSVTCDL